MIWEPSPNVERAAESVASLVNLIVDICAQVAALVVLLAVAICGWISSHPRLTLAAVATAAAPYLVIVAYHWSNGLRMAVRNWRGQRWQPRR